MKKIVSFRHKTGTDFYLCDIEEIPLEQEKDYFGQEDIVKWSYGWGEIGYSYQGKLLGTTKFVGRKKDHLWVFYEPNGNFNRPESMYYDDRMLSTRSKLFKLIRKIKQVDTEMG